MTTFSKGVSSGAGCLVVLVCIILFIVIISIGLGGGGGKETQSIEKQTNEKRAGTSDSMAYAQAQNYVKMFLKSPSSAKFPWSNYNCKTYKNDLYLISSYVDSQNSFGAMIRSDYSVLLKYLGGDDLELSNWELEKMIFDGKLVYESSESKFSQQDIGKQGASEVSQQVTEEQKVSPSPSSYSLGKSAVVDNIRFTVIKYKVTKECHDKYQSQYYGPIQAPEGARFLWLYTKAINEDEVARKLPYEGTDIYLKYEGNRIYHSVACFVESKYHASVDEKVYPEVSREGWVLYEIPENLNLSLTYVIVEIVELGKKKGEALWKLGS